MQVNQIAEHLHMALGLHKTAHHAERADRFPVPGEKARNNRVERFLARCITVGGIRIQRKTAAAVLKGNPGPGHHDAGTKSHIIALNIADHVSFPVRRAQINRAGSRGIPVGRKLRRVCDFPGPCLSVGFCKKVLGGNAHGGRV